MADNPQHQSTMPTTPDEVRLRLMLAQRQREVDRLRALLREWVEADRELREHPETDTTKRWSRKLYRLGAARDAAEKEVAAHV